MPVIENSPNRSLVFFLSVLLALIILFLSFPNQSQWFITRFLVNSPLGYEQYIKNHPKNPYLEKASWRLAQTKEDPALYLDYAADFPKSPKREEAMWTAARLLHTPAGYWEYFKNYPDAKYPRDRGYKVNQLRVSALVYRDRQNVQQAYPTLRFRTRTEILTAVSNWANSPGWPIISICTSKVLLPVFKTMRGIAPVLASCITSRAHKMHVSA
jgi:hypothetical protein